MSTERPLSYVIQIFTGGFYDKQVTYDAIEEKLRLVVGQLPIRHVLIGWAIDEKLYGQVNEFLKHYNIPLYLWLPVFSEVNQVYSSEPIVLASGEELKPFHLNDGEGFEFMCPTSAGNKENIIKLFDQYFSSSDFHGVFLDRIRYPGFSNGYESIFSCFCPRCLNVFRDEGVDVDYIREQTEQAKVDETVPFDITGYSRLSYSFTDSRWRLFFDVKHKMINKALEEIIEAFKQRELQVGLDVFAPSVADFIGQDILSLSKRVEFIKPMMYYRTFAPAGVNFEHAIRLNGFKQQAQPKNNIKDKKILESELQDIMYLAEQANCDIIPGFEVNYVKEIAETDLDYISEQLSDYRTIDKIKAVNLSWNLMDMPIEHLQYLLEEYKR